MPAAKVLVPSSAGSAGCQCRTWQHRALPVGMRLRAAYAAQGAWHALPQTSLAQTAAHPRQETCSFLFMSEADTTLFYIADK